MKRLNPKRLNVLLIVTSIFLLAVLTSPLTVLQPHGIAGATPPATGSAPQDNLAENTPPPPPPTPTVYPEIDYSAVRPYEAGQIMIIMYHGLTEEPPESSYQRSAEDFRNDLQELYDNGFRVISMTDYINNNITTAPGYTPVVLTFDDGLSTAFSLIREDGVLVPKPDTAVAIMEEFYAKNPGFGKSAVFYISGKEDTFKGEGTFAERLNWLVDNGYELGNHTWDHANLSNISTAQEIQRQLGLTDKAIKDAIPGYMPVGISYPFGIHPIESLRTYLRYGEYEGHQYSYTFGLNVGDSGTPSAPNRNGFDPFKLPRVRGSNDEQTDLGWKLYTEYVNFPDMRYKSDGNPDRIASPREYSHNIDPDSLGGKELYIYD